MPFEDPNTSQLYKKILNADYKIPSFISKDGASILKGILETDENKRLTIQQIRDHPWYKQHEEINYKGIIVGTDQIPVDDNLLDELKKFDYDLDYSRKCIEANKHNNVTASYNLLLKSKLRDGAITYKEAYECKNDLTSLMRRHPRFQNLNHDMPEHLRLHNRTDDKYNSMPPKTRVPKEEPDSSDTKPETVNGVSKPRPLKIDSDIEKEIKSRRRTGSTGGSSMKDAEIIGHESKKKVGSPSPSPVGHPEFPLNKAPMLKHVLASNNPHITISDTNSLNNTTIIKNHAIDGLTVQKNKVDFSALFKNKGKSKKKNHKGVSQSDLSSGTPIGIGHLAPPPISIGFGLPRGRHKKAATAFDYENLNNSFQLDRFRHNTITATPSHRNRKKRKGSKKVRVSCDLNNSLISNAKNTPMSTKKMMSLMNSTINHQMLDISARPVSVLNKTIYTTGLREQILQFPNILLQKKKKNKKFRVRSRGESPKSNNMASSNLYLAYMRGNQSKIKSAIGYNTQNLNNSMNIVRSHKNHNYATNRKLTLGNSSRSGSKKVKIKLDKRHKA